MNAFINYRSFYNFSYKFNDPELKSLIEAVDEMFTTISTGFPEDKIPGFKYICESKQLKKMKSLYTILKKFTDNSYQEHIRTFQRGRFYFIFKPIRIAKAYMSLLTAHPDLPLTVSFYTIEYINGEQMPRLDFALARDESDYLRMFEDAFLLDLAKFFFCTSALVIRIVWIAVSFSVVAIQIRSM